MQMLDAGGVSPLTDRQREADENNPRGYLEFEAVKSLKSNPAALDESEGHAVKVVAMLLPHLPPGRTYQVLFLHRRLDEVVASQRKMIERLGRPAAPISDSQLQAVLERQVEQALWWCADTPGVQCLELQHRSLCLTPEVAVQKIGDFLGGGIDREAMLAVPDPALYRERH